MLRANDCVVVSAKGDCNTLMAGGDFDGDLNMLSFNTDLIELAEATAEAVERSDWFNIEKACPGNLLVSRKSQRIFQTNSTHAVHPVSAAQQTHFLQAAGGVFCSTSSLSSFNF